MSNFADAPDYYDAGLHNVPFRLDIREITPNVGDPTKDIYRIVTVAHDVSISQAWVSLSFRGNPPSGTGSLQLQLLQEKTDGVVEDISDLVSFDEAPGIPILLPIQRELLVVGFPIFLRMTFTPGKTASWFQGIQSVNGAIHFMGRR